jgi:F420-0:gamma-glutamyl ligase
MYAWPGSCAPCVWLTVRSTASLGICCASSGTDSANRTPGVAVAMAPYSPRTSAAAAGLGSKVS